MARIEGGGGDSGGGSSDSTADDEPDTGGLTESGSGPRIDPTESDQAQRVDVSDSQTQRGGDNSQPPGGSGNASDPPTDNEVTVPGDVSNWKETLTDEEVETVLRQNTERANQTPSLGTTGIGTSGTNQSRKRADARASQSQSLSTTGIGTSGTSQSRLRQQTPRASAGPGLDTDTFGTTSQPPSGDAGTMERAENIGAGATTVADRELQRGEQRERVREQALQQLEDQGVDTDRVNVDIERSGGGFQASVSEDTDEEFGDVAVRFPGITDEESNLEEDVENAIGVAVSPLGPNTDEVAEAAFTATGLEGRRFENVFGDASSQIQSTIQENAEAGGDAVVSGTISQLPGLTFGTADTVRNAFESSDVTIAGRNISDTVDQQSEGFFVGSTSLADVPGTIVGAKEASEYLGYAATETAAGNAGDVASDTEEAASTAVMQGVEAAEENPNRIGGQVAGSLLTSTALMGGASTVSSRAGAATRYAIQPGEELLTGAATKAASRSSRAASFVDELPGGKIDTEEIAIAGGRRGINVGRTAVARAKSRVDTRSGESLFGDTRGQLDPSFVPDQEVTIGETESEIESGGDDPLSLLDEVEQRPRPDYRQNTGYEGEFSDFVPQSEVTLGRTELDTESRLRAETELERGAAEASTLLDQASQPSLDVRARQTQGFDAGQILGVRTQQEVRSLTETDAQTDLFAEVATETQAESNTRLRSRIETGTLLEQELETRQEIESETELMSELESEQEQEGLLERDPEEDEEGSAFFSGESAVFDSGIASAEELLQRSQD